MTETTNHRAPLAPGEIRTHTVGSRTFLVMHVAGGSFTQASYRDADRLSVVIESNRSEDAAVRAYADAIEQAESDTDAVEPDLTFNTPDGASTVLVTGEVPESCRIDRDPSPASAWALKGGSQPAPSLADDVAELRRSAALAFGAGSSWVAAIDRIAAQVPVRARRNNGRAMWQHLTCGSVMAFNDAPGMCNCREAGAWRPLYTLGGAA